MTKDQLLQQIRDGASLSRGSQLRLVVLLSMPAMMAQLSTIVMEYIDAAMVGSLGAEASASIGIVSTTIWLFGSLSHSASTGFYVQVAHLAGAGKWKEARNILRQSIGACVAFSALLMVIGVAISWQLPLWLGGEEAIAADASFYFLVFAVAMPLSQLNSLMGGMLRCSGNMKVPAMLNIMMCTLDVVFNYIFIMILGMGVQGAALGTFLAYATASVVMTWFCCRKSDVLNILQDEGSYRPTMSVLRKALNIAGPIGIEHLVMCGAQIVSTIIVAPLGTIAIAANSFGITIEALCYMPGYGISDAATTLVGQSIGAKRRTLARSFANITVGVGIAVMTMMGIVMFIGSPWLMSLMTPDAAVQSLTTEVLRIEAFAEPMFAAAIVCYGVFVGVGETKIPCTINLASIWVVRITLAALMASTYGLRGVWMAMAIELCFRGIVFLCYLKRSSKTCFAE